MAPELPEAYENQVLEFHSYVINIWKTYNVELSQITNMDEVPFTLDVPSKRTVDVKGAKTMAVRISGHEKTHFTVLACCADGCWEPPCLVSEAVTPHG